MRIGGGGGGIDASVVHQGVVGALSPRNAISTLHVCADVPVELVPTPAEAAKLMAQTRRERDAGCRNVPCLLWTGTERTRYRRTRWLPRRLFYTLGVPDGHARMQHKTIVPACGRAACVEVLHMQVSAYRPPTKQRTSANKRKFGDDMALRATSDCVHVDDDSGDESVATKSRRLMDQLYAQLAAIEAEGSNSDDDESFALDLPAEIVDQIIGRRSSSSSSSSTTNLHE